MYDFAQHSLNPREARLLRHYVDESTGSEYLVVAWTGLERDYFEEYKGFLEKFTWLTNFEANPNDVQRIVDNPMVGPEEVRYSGAWLRTSVVKADDSGSELSMTLLRVYDDVKDSDGVYRAVLLNKDQFRSSEANLVLQFRNLDPRNLDALAKSRFSVDDLSNIQTKNDTYSGTWYIVASPSATDESGAGVITLYVTRHNNDDVVYRYYAAPGILVTDFFKYRMLESGKLDFESNYYFDSDGMYYSADGEKYTRLDTVEVDPSVNLPETAFRVNQAAPGRTVQMSENRREDDRTTDMVVQLVFHEDQTAFGLIYKDSHDSVLTEIQRTDISETARDEQLANTYIDSDGNWYWSENGTTYTRKNGVAVAETAFTDPAYPLNVSVEGRSLRSRVLQDASSRQWTVELSVRHLSSDVRISYLGSDSRINYKPSNLATIAIDQAHNITHAELMTAMAYYNSTPPAGRSRTMGPTRRDDESGLYSYDALEITKTAVAAVFRIGPETRYVGYNHPKEPTTDLAAFLADSGISSDPDDPTSDTYYLVGGVYDSGWTCLIDSTSNVSPEIGQNAEDGTWNWNIRHYTEDTVSIGEPDPSAATGAFIFEHGDPNDYERWAGRYQMEEIVAGALSLIGYYEQIPTNTFGTHAVLAAGRRKVTRSIRNERLKDRKISFDVFDRVETADINEDDDWFLIGGTEAWDRNKRNISTEILGHDGKKLTISNADNTVFTHLLTQPDGTVDHLDDSNYDLVVDTDDVLADEAMNDTTVPIIAQLQAAIKRRKTVKRERKYFMRRPTTSDLQGTISYGSVSIYTHWQAVVDADTNDPASNPSVSPLVTFDIVHVGGQWAVERMTITLDDEFYRDDDAFDHLKDSDGNSVLGVQLQLVHMQTADDSGVTIDPTVVDSDKLHLRS